MEKEKRFCSENVILCRTSLGIYLRDRAIVAEGSMQERGVRQPGKSWSRWPHFAGVRPVSRALFIAHLWGRLLHHLAARLETVAMFPQSPRQPPLS